MDPIVSVLLPTRKRVKNVEVSLRTLLEKATDPTAVEICIAYDDDDIQSHEYFSGKEWRKFVDEFGFSTVVEQSQRWGYLYLNKYYNSLAEKSHAPWLFLWNDDAYMETDEWDRHLIDNIDYRMLLHITCSNLVMTCSIFPLFHRDWIKLFGMVSPINHADSWISEICRKAQARRVIPVSTFHDRGDLTGNNRDETFFERDYSAHNEYHSQPMIDMRQEWAERLRSYLQNR